MFEVCKFEKLRLCLSILLSKSSNCWVLAFAGSGMVGSNGALSILLDTYEARDEDSNWLCSEILTGSCSG